MDDIRGPMEARLLHVERGLAGIDSDLHALRREIAAAGQGIWDAWADARGGTGSVAPPPPATFAATYTGTLHGCNSLPLDGETVTIKDAGGAVLDTQTTDSSGNFSGSLTLASDPQTLGVDSGPARFNALATNVAFNSGANALGTFTLTPDGSHACVAGCARPAKTTILVTDSVYGTFSMTYVGTSHVWTSGNHVVAFAGAGACAASSTQVVWGLSQAGVGSVGYSSTAPPCPTATGVFQSIVGTLASSACPPSFSLVYNVSGALYSGTQTLTFTE